ncbi:Uncharacterized protein PECH_000819 [Penicillium ucsense]|uniref:Nephrocystin 3-like N-terminal domain-containing protein n=1 Tax=Penicillium ucsense TaxID=2839758 RepID=A0A8J8W2F5_9EURO|nr:Uncharacterized protein PECM_000504 [Penicillium ucsense]KAF7733317.1 Uncharacterized protein PECH_000819 [Penicillium ucsense]
MSSSFFANRPVNSRQVSSFSATFDDSVSQNGRSARRENGLARRYNGVGSSNITDVVQALHRRSGNELGNSASSLLLNTSYHSIVEWIRVERMNHLPPEGSSYDKVLSWAQLFIDRLHSFDNGIRDFAGDSYLAAQLSYGYCAMLLELGKDNAPALMISFGFFYSTSSALVNLLERTELFAVSQEIKEQLILALSDLVTLVASVSTYYHKAIRGLTTASVSVNIYDTFPSQIQSFRDRCKKIAEAMWRHQLVKENIDSEHVTIVNELRSWLAPEDRVLSHLVENTSQLALEREEMTCLWLGPYLARFLKSDCQKLSLYGAPGSGKSVLASVIVDRLQEHVGGVTYNTIFVPINARVPVQTTPIAIAKTILSQLFEKRIGNIQLLNILRDAFDRARTTFSLPEYEDILWNSLERALSASLRGAKELVLVIDGLDEATCGETALLERLTTATASAAGVRLITLGSEKPSTKDKAMGIPVTEGRIADDIAAVVRKSFEKCRVFHELGEMEQETIVDQITEASHGSFLWAKLAVKRIRHETSLEALHKMTNFMINGKWGVADFVTHVLASTDISEESRLMLLWLATAERPLTLKELTALALVHVDKQIISDRKIDTLANLKPFTSLITIQDGQVSLRHGLIRVAVLDAYTKGKLLSTVKDRHADLLTRLLIYMKATVIEQHDLSMTGLDRHDVNMLVQKHTLLDFCVRYWPHHLRNTKGYSNGGEALAAKELGKQFPANITLLLLQSSLWQSISTPTLLTYLTIVTGMSRHILTPDHKVSLQSMIFLALLRRDVRQFSEAASLLYEVAVVSRKLLGIKHIITLQISSIFLDLTVDQITSTKTEIMKRREEILYLIVECYQIHYGSSSDKVVATLRILLDHHRLLKEDIRIREIETKIKVITGGRYDDTDSDGHGNLHVHLRGCRASSESGTLFTLDTELDEYLSEAFDFEALLLKAQTYVAQGLFVEAERVYVEIWQRSSMECRVKISEYWEQIKLKSVTVYSRFLQSQKRESEATSILSSVWEEYRSTNFSVTESTSVHFREIAMIMATVGLSTAALSIYKHCAQYYKSVNKTESAEYKEISKNIEYTSQQVVRQASSSSTVVSETVLEEIVFEASTSINTIDESSFTATYTLVELYVAQHRWRDATRVVKKVLHGLWPSLFAPSIEDVLLPSKHIEKCVELAERLCQCYHYRRRFSREEGIRLRVFRAVRATKPVDDKTRERVSTGLLLYYEESCQLDLIISTRQEILDDYVAHYGPEHPVVIKALWALAELTRPRPISIEYYQRIIRAMNKDSPHCHQDALEPLIIVLTELWNQSRYSDAVSYYALLFGTFLHDHKRSAKFQSADFVHETFSRYTYCLRHVRVEYSEIHKVSVDYQSKVKTIFGATALITVKATLSLARVCQESKRFEADAIALYEELLAMKVAEFDREEVIAILDGLYEEQTTTITSKSETMSSTQIERFSKVMRKRMTTVRETHGWAHEESLTKLREIVTFHSKYSESSEVVLTELKESTVQILQTESSSTRLVAAASTIAEGYITTKQVAKATEITQELYRQIVMKETKNVKVFNFDLTAKGRQSLIFLAQLELSLLQHKKTITEVLAILTAEYVYFEDLRSCIHAKSSSFYTVSLSASRVYHFLLSNHRQEAATRVFDDYTAYFIANEGKRTKLVETKLVKVFLSTILDHLQNHKSTNFIRSVGIASTHRVVDLLQKKDYDCACDLAFASFKYISAHDEYRSAAIVKFVLSLGINITGRTVSPRPDHNTQRKLIGVSSVIVQDVLRVVGDLKISLAHVNLEYLNILISVLGEQKDYKNLAWVLSGLWNSRNQRPDWSPAVTLQLARRYILARYLAGDALKASRLAEDIVYNCRRVNGARHQSTLEMSTLLSQLYAGIAQRYQAEKGGQHMAHKYYKKIASVHETLLRTFVDPFHGDVEGGIDGNMSMDGSSYDIEIGDSQIQSSISDVEQVRQHMQLLKLAVQRLGDWPKDFAEYQRLNDDLVDEFGDELSGVERVEKWDVKKFGGGKASGDEDQLKVDAKMWELDLNQAQAEEVEEEL